MVTAELNADDRFKPTIFEKVAMVNIAHQYSNHNPLTPNIKLATATNKSDCMADKMNRMVILCCLPVLKKNYLKG